MIELAAGAISHILISAIDRAFADDRKEDKVQRQRLAESVHAGLRRHHIEVTNWCHEHHQSVFGATGVDTVELRFESIARRFGVRGKLLSEADLLLSSSNVVVLGDPGAGKTTTLKRLTALVATDGPLAGEDDFRFVVLVVCREQDWSVQPRLVNLLAERIGVDADLAGGTQRADRAVDAVLESGALIVVDGLDEVPAAQRDALDRDLVSLGRSLLGSKVLVSCRSGAYDRELDGFQQAEIQALDDVQVQDIVRHHLGDQADDFAQRLLDQNSHVAGLADRPLFLGQMINVYRRRGTIPMRSVDLYSAILNLVLEEWDVRRGVKRASRYADFTIDDKRRFLADLALALICRGRFRFESGDLISCYDDLHRRHDLPKNEARRVAGEIESHTGIIVQSGGAYEFSHLSLQEYLAADSLSRSAGDDYLEGWWRNTSEVAAVATTLSSRPNAWVGQLAYSLPAVLAEQRQIQRFTQRLVDEQPRFEASAELGQAILIIVAAGNLSAVSYERLHSLHSIRKSLDLCIEQAKASGDLRVVGDEVQLSTEGFAHNAPNSVLRLPTEGLSSSVGRERWREIQRS